MLKRRDNLAALEVKSSSSMMKKSGIDLFIKTCKTQRVVCVGLQGISVEEFLKKSITGFID